MKQKNKNIAIVYVLILLKHLFQTRRKGAGKLFLSKGPCLRKMSTTSLYSTLLLFC